VNYFDQDEEFQDVLSLEGLVAIDPNERDLLACMGFADTMEAPLVNLRLSFRLLLFNSQYNQSLILDTQMNVINRQPHR
jgi:hypothetical protein